MGGGGSIAKRDGVKINTNEGLDSPSSPSNFYSVSSQAAVALDTSLGGRGIDTHQPAKWTPLESPHNKNKTTCWRGGESKNREQKVGVVLLLLLHMARTKVSPSFHPLLLSPSLSVCCQPTMHFCTAVGQRERSKNRCHWRARLVPEGDSNTNAQMDIHTHVGKQRCARDGPRSAFLFGFSPPLPWRPQAYVWA